MVHRADTTDTVGSEMVLNLLHIDSELSKVLNKLILLLHHDLDFLLCCLVRWDAVII